MSLTFTLTLCFGFVTAIGPSHHVQVLSDGSLLAKDHYASLLRSETLGHVTHRGGHAPVDVQGSTFSNELSNVTQSIDHLQGNVSSVDVMRVKMDGNGDTLELLSTVIFTMTVSVWMLVAFKILSSYYPVLYSQRELEHLGFGEASAGWAQALRDVTSLWHQLSLACFLKEEHVLEVQGLDSWMHLQFQWLALRILGCLAIVPVILCPLHWTHGSSTEVFSRLNLAVNESRPFVLWIHVLVVFGVTIFTTRTCQVAMKDFMPIRYRWLQRMPFPQCTTVLVEGIPESMCSDLRLHSYFANLFGDNAVARSYVVRNTKLLQKKLERWRKAQRALEKARLRSEADGSTSASSSPLVQFRLESVKDIKEEVDAERIRLGRLSHALDPDVSTSTGFVTFKTRLDMRLAAREQLGTDAFALQLQAAPEVNDVLYDSLIIRPSYTQQRLGYLSVFCVFVAFLPAVVFVSTLLSLKSWQQIFPVIHRWRQSMPIVIEMLEGVLATLSLKIMLAFIPAILLKIARSFLKPVSQSSSQLFLQKTYFAFLVIFVLLVTSFAQAEIPERWICFQAEQGLCKDPSSFNAAITCHSRQGHFEAAERLVRFMCEHNVEPDVVTLGAAVHSCARGNRPRQAEELFEMITRRGHTCADAVGYNALIDAWVRAEDVSRAEQWLQHMLKAEVVPTVVSYTSILHAYAKQGDIQAAEKVMEQMKEKDLEANVVTYTALINACVKAGDIPRAERCFDFMQIAGVEANAMTYSSLLNVCAKAGDYLRAEVWLEKMMSSALVPTEVCFNNVIDACSKAGQGKRAEEWLWRLQGGVSYGLRATRQSYTAAAQAYAKVGAFMDVERIFRVMEAKGISMDAFSLTVQLSSYARSRPRQRERMEETLRRYHSQGLRITPPPLRVAKSVLGNSRLQQLLAEMGFQEQRCHNG